MRQEDERLRLQQAALCLLQTVHDARCTFGETAMFASLHSRRKGLEKKVLLLFILLLLLLSELLHRPHTTIYENFAQRDCAGDLNLYQAATTASGLDYIQEYGDIAESLTPTEEK